jgi:RecJ-like exonuclease
MAKSYKDLTLEEKMAIFNKWVEDKKERQKKDWIRFLDCWESEEVQCDECQGEGVITCPDCNGVGHWKEDQDDIYERVKQIDPLLLR